MRHTTLMLFLLLARVGSAQEDTLSRPKILRAPGEGYRLHSSKAPVGVHNIPLCQTYDHYVHYIPTTWGTDYHLRNVQPDKNGERDVQVRPIAHGKAVANK